VSEPRVVRIEVAAHRSDGSVIHMSMSVEPPSPPPVDPPPAHSTPPEEHTIYFHSRSDGFNIFWRATCACGWESGDCGEEVAGLAADEHLRPFERIALP
jgi:hypothetical protein